MQSNHTDFPRSISPSKYQSNDNKDTAALFMNAVFLLYLSPYVLDSLLLFFLRPLCLYSLPFPTNCMVQQSIYDIVRISHLLHLGNSCSVPRGGRGRWSVVGEKRGHYPWALCPNPFIARTGRLTDRQAGRGLLPNLVASPTWVVQ